MKWRHPHEWRDPTLDIDRIRHDVEYFKEREQYYNGSNNGAHGWFVNVHRHECPACLRIITHTGLEALREGDAESHTCCGRDVRVKV